ncbi:MAG TPA: cupredoxin domain-containing protein [Mycobacteriales bacterium]|nr:cupredoxin domain-containing protein [Mycobacteriales bacterium]
MSTSPSALARTGRVPAALAAGALLLAGCGGEKAASGEDLKVTGTTNAKGVGDQQTAAIKMTDDLTFQPNLITAHVGSLALTTSNVGSIPHNLVFADSAKGSLPSVKGHATATLRVPLAKAGKYRFTCTFHHGMDGEVVVSG